MKLIHARHHRMAAPAAVVFALLLCLAATASAAPVSAPASAASSWRRDDLRRWEAAVRLVKPARRTRRTIARRPATVHHLTTSSLSASTTGGAAARPLFTEDGGADGGETKRIQPNMSEVFGGSRASNWVAKHLAYIDISYYDGGNGACTGFVISSSHVMTAAHCLENYGKFDVSSVTVSIGLRPDVRSTFRATYVDVHKDYLYRETMNDIALIWVDGTFPSSLAKAAYVASELPEDGADLFVAGYGVKTNGRFPTRLQEASMKYRQFDVCAPMVPEFLLDMFVEDAVICGVDPDFPNGGNVDTCSGDSGGPFYAKNEAGRRTITVYGITSFGPDRCATTGVGAWYTNVAHFYDDLVTYFRRDFDMWNEVYRAF